MNDFSSALNGYVSTKAIGLVATNCQRFGQEVQEHTVFGCPKREAKRTGKRREPPRMKMKSPLPIALNVGDHNIEANAELYKKEPCFVVQRNMRHVERLENLKNARINMMNNYNV